VKQIEDRLEKLLKNSDPDDRDAINVAINTLDEKQADEIIIDFLDGQIRIPRRDKRITVMQPRAMGGLDNGEQRIAVEPLRQRVHEYLWQMLRDNDGWRDGRHVCRQQV